MANHSTRPLKPPARLTIAPAFKLVFFSVLGLTVLCLAGMVALVVIFQTPNDQVKGAIELFSTLAKLGFGSIIGLLGGKVLP